jgi:hypothetical protein
MLQKNLHLMYKTTNKRTSSIKNKSWMIQANQWTLIHCIKCFSKHNKIITKIMYKTIQNVAKEETNVAEANTNVVMDAQILLHVIQSVTTVTRKVIMHEIAIKNNVMMHKISCTHYNSRLVTLPTLQIQCIT